jgi:selenocysteine-specific elongation factor
LIQIDFLKKKRGITIELGFAYTKNNEQDILGFVDVPGHEKFINTMVSGAIGVDHGLLVIAADDGIMPQTIEHLRILEFLQIDALTVVITKIDLVDLIRLDQVTHEIKHLLENSRFYSTNIFPVSSYTEQGILELKSYLSELQVSITNKNNGFRLAVDRVFITKGMGVTVTGAIQSGNVANGDELLLMPDHIPVKVRSIHAQGQTAVKASVGNRCGLVLSGVELTDVRRGQWLVSPHLMQGVERFDAKIDLSKDARFDIKDGDILLLYHGTDFTSARLILLEKNQLNPGESTLVQCVLQKPLSMCWSDRFILRDTSARFTLSRRSRTRYLSTITES